MRVRFVRGRVETCVRFVPRRGRGGGRGGGLEGLHRRAPALLRRRPRCARARARARCRFGPAELLGGALRALQLQLQHLSLRRGFAPPRDARRPHARRGDGRGGRGSGRKVLKWLLPGTCERHGRVWRLPRARGKSRPESQVPKTSAQTKRQPKSNSGGRGRGMCLRARESRRGGDGRGARCAEARRAARLLEWERRVARARARYGLGRDLGTDWAAPPRGRAVGVGRAPGGSSSVEENQLAVGGREGDAAGARAVPQPRGAGGRADRRGRERQMEWGRMENSPPPPLSRCRLREGEGRRGKRRVEKEREGERGRERERGRAAPEVAGGGATAHARDRRVGEGAGCDQMRRVAHKHVQDRGPGERAHALQPRLYLGPQQFPAPADLPARPRVSHARCGSCAPTLGRRVVPAPTVACAGACAEGCMGGRACAVARACAVGRAGTAAALTRSTRRKRSAFTR
jgi:hypothetical protein